MIAMPTKDKYSKKYYTPNDFNHFFDFMIKKRIKSYNNRGNAKNQSLKVENNYCYRYNTTYFCSFSLYFLYNPPISTWRYITT